MTADDDEPERPASWIGSYLVGLALLAVAGWVDAIGFVHWNGLFVSFMSGNTTRMSVLGVLGRRDLSGVALAVIGVFVAGVVAGELVRLPAGRRGRTAVLALEALVLAGATAWSHEGAPSHAIALLLGFAMGVQNASIHRADRLGMALTYVTGTLVKFGQALASIVVGRGGWGRLGHFGGLWTALAAGAFAGGTAAHYSEAAALAAACGLVTGLVIVSALIGPADEG